MSGRVCNFNTYRIKEFFFIMKAPVYPHNIVSAILWRYYVWTLYVREIGTPIYIELKYHFHIIMHIFLKTHRKYIENNE